jgi:bis(5'-adenosyl)-triphosphatase
MLDGEEGNLGKTFRDAEAGTQADGTVKTEEAASKPGRRSRFPAVDNEGRKSRSEEEMRAEAEMLAREMENEPID